MKPRLYLISIAFAIIASLFAHGKFNIFQIVIINFLNKELMVSTEMVISLVILFTLFLVLLMGLLDKVFFTKKEREKTNKED